MSRPIEQAGREDVERPLPRMIRLVRDRRADRMDATEAMREVCLVRLEILADELEPVFADVPESDAQFDFVISSGLKPRLWIDATAHVAMAQDCRTYRFVRDTRSGRIVLGESDRTAPIVEEVTRHIAERMVERQYLLDGRREPAKAHWDPVEASPSLPARPDAGRMGEYLSGVILVILGMIAGAGILAVILSDLLPSIF